MMQPAHEDDLVPASRDDADADARALAHRRASAGAADASGAGGAARRLLHQSLPGARRRSATTRLRMRGADRLPAPFDRRARGAEPIMTNWSAGHLARCAILALVAC